MNQEPAGHPSPSSDETDANPWADMAVGVFFLITAVAVFFGAQSYAPQNLTLGPQSFPRLLAVLTIPLGLILIGRSIWTLNHPIEKESLNGLRITEFKTIAIAFCALVLYVASMAFIGYIDSTILFLCFMIRYLGERRWWLIALVSVCVTFVLYYVFDRQLNVPLPRWFEFY